MKRVFSGIQPSGLVHLGNYLGALRQWVLLQDQHECLYCIVDLHAITIPQKPKDLELQIRQTAALCLAIGINPERSILFVQSDVSEHGELAWILSCHAYMGELRRMTQFKDKSGSNQEESIGAGLFNYPVLMAADILLYNAQAVPVGEDQRQHLELSRDLSRRFNNLYGDVFYVPEPIIVKAGSRVMGLDDPLKKMSKSASSQYNYITLMDTPDQIRAKIKVAVTDSGREIRYDEGQKPAISNLLTIFSLVTNRQIAALERDYEGKGYGVFKKDLGEAVCEFVRPIQKEYAKRLDDPALDSILSQGASKASDLARRQIKIVKQALGLGFSPVH
ncbi:MAG: tryptophan--tRNA ligase [Elusimicrobia bacterium]|nr:tryptophan--tRNA ligase [Elusimicrobiota bacterium]